MAAKWTRASIIRIIVARDAAGQRLTVGGEAGVPRGLYRAGSRVFGSWPNAIQAAGVTVHSKHRRVPLSPGKVLSAIHALARRGRPMQANELRGRYSHLASAAQRFFGSWTKAVIAAGVNPDRLQRTSVWTKECVLEAILLRALNNQPLGIATVTPRSLGNAGARIFGSWRSALAAAGIVVGEQGCEIVGHAGDQARSP